MRPAQRAGSRAKAVAHIGSMPRGKAPYSDEIPETKGVPTRWAQRRTQRERSIFQQACLHAARRCVGFRAVHREAAPHDFANEMTASSHEHRPLAPLVEGFEKGVAAELTTAQHAQEALVCIQRDYWADKR